MANNGLPGRAAGAVAALLALTACTHSATKHATPPHSVINPVVRQRADPSVLKAADGYYYLTDSVPDHNAIELRRARTLGGLSTAVPVTVLGLPAGSAIGRIWAPDLSYDDGTWFLYYSASPASDSLDSRLYSMQSSAADPMTGTWTQNGRLRTDRDSPAVDATSFAAADGRRYLVWAEKVPGTEGKWVLDVGLLGTPTSFIGTQARLSEPEYPWEQVGALVNEAPAVLQSHGKVWITYSANIADGSYTMGLLSAASSADLLDPASWTKSPTPVFASSTASSVFGPGSNSFTMSDDGLDVIDVYHARSYGPVADPLTDRNRAIRMQKVSWRPDGTPDFGTPVPDGPTTE